MCQPVNLLGLYLPIQVNRIDVENFYQIRTLRFRCNFYRPHKPANSTGSSAFSGPCIGGHTPLSSMMEGEAPGRQWWIIIGILIQRRNESRKSGWAPKSGSNSKWLSFVWIFIHVLVLSTANECGRRPAKDEKGKGHRTIVGMGLTAPPGFSSIPRESVPPASMICSSKYLASSQHSTTYLKKIKNK